MRTAVFIAALAWVTAAPTSAAAAPAAFDPNAYGAISNDAGDDRAAIQSAIDAAAPVCGDVALGDGVFLIGRAGSNYYGLRLPGCVHLRGAGRDVTVLRQTAGIGGGVRLVQIDGADDVTISDLMLDGAKSQQTVDEHRAGIFVKNATRVRVERVTSVDFTGDGFYLFNGTRGASFTEVMATGNGRDGIAFGGTVDGTRIARSDFIANGVQQIDSEPVGSAVVTGTTVIDCTIDGGTSNEYALTISGTPTAHGAGWRVLGNTIHGPVFIVWSGDVLLAGNAITNDTTKSAVTIYRSSSSVSVIANAIAQTQTAVRSLAGVMVQGTGTGDAPIDALIAGNDITVAYEQAFGVRAEGAISVSVLNNQMHGPGRAALVFYAGVYLRATNPAEPFERAVVDGNTISDFGSRGVSVHGNLDARLVSLQVSRNTYADHGSPAVMTVGASFDDGSHPVQQLIVGDDVCVGGVSTCATNFPPGVKPVEF